MKYTATLEWKQVELNFNPKYDPLDFLRNNDIFEDAENIDMKVILELILLIHFG